MDREDLPLIGVFATRSNYRPNYIALTTVELLAVDGHVLKVKGLDALDGTPVLDIKPYVPHKDYVENARLPAWTQKLRDEQADG
jgi:tRNA (Thr-GGU) A37 N-methylase